MKHNNFDEYLLEKNEQKILKILDAPKYKAQVKDFLSKANKEIGEYKEAGVILKNAAMGKKMSKDDEHKIIEQLIDTLKMGTLGTVFVLPMGSLIIIILLRIGKRYNMNFLPSSWKQKTA